MIQLMARREYSFVLSLSLTILVGLGGLALVHPNAVVSAAVFAVPMLLGGVVQVLRTRGASTRERLVGTGVLVALIAGCVTILSLIHIWLRRPQRRSTRRTRRRLPPHHLQPLRLRR